MKNWKPLHFFIIAISVIVLDQIVKYLIHQNMVEYGSIPLLGDWLSLNYQTNPGMAWGQTIPGGYGKLILTSFRIVVAFLIPMYMIKLHKSEAHKGLILCIAFVLAGAVGNLVDSIIYGVLDERLLVNEAPFALLHGKVIDMFYVDLYHSYDFPVLGELHLWPVFNVADASIFCSVIAILIFNKRFFPEGEDKQGLFN